MADRFYINADFENERVTLDIENQKGTECVPGFHTRREPILSNLPLQTEKLASAEVDTDTGEIKLTYRFDTEKFDGEALLMALGMMRVDIGNSIELLEMYFEGKLSKSEIQALLESEAESNDKNPEVTELLRQLRED